MIITASCVDFDLESVLKQDSCNVWAPGIEIIAVRVTKPRIPDSVRAAFENMQAEATKCAVEHCS